MYKNPFHHSDLSDKSFLITGGAGFIGSNIATYLMKFNAGKVRVFDNLSNGYHRNIEGLKNHPNFQFFEGDICDPEACKIACEGVDFVLHQAALGSVPRSIQNPLATNLANVNGFLNMLVASKDAGVKRVVYASSSSVYGDSKELPKREDIIGKPLSPYAVTKQINELYADVFSKTYNMEIIGLRYFNVYGPNQDPRGPYAAAMPLFIEALLENRSPFINGDGEQTRDFTFVENAVQANIKALFTDNPEALNQVFNVAVGEKISLNQLFKLIQKNTGSLTPPTYREERIGDIRDSLADISKANKLIDYNPEIRLEEGLKITIDWFKNIYKQLS